MISSMTFSKMKFNFHLKKSVLNNITKMNLMNHKSQDSITQVEDLRTYQKTLLKIRK